MCENAVGILLCNQTYNLYANKKGKIMGIWFEILVVVGIFLNVVVLA